MSWERAKKLCGRNNCKEYSRAIIQPKGKGSEGSRPSMIDPFIDRSLSLRFNRAGVLSSRVRDAKD